MTEPWALVEITVLVIGIDFVTGIVVIMVVTGTVVTGTVDFVFVLFVKA